jgi:DNA-binding transcriptional ArsR family regulator
MVNRPDALSTTFAALADPTRRGILEQLAAGETRVTRLAEPYRLSLPAVSKHLRVLERARLIRRARVGREHRIRIDPTPLDAARNWMALYADAWRHQLESLARFLQATAGDEAPKQKSSQRRTRRRPPRKGSA